MTPEQLKQRLLHQEIRHQKLIDVLGHSSESPNSHNIYVVAMSADSHLVALNQNLSWWVTHTGPDIPTARDWQALSAAIGAPVTGVVHLPQMYVPDFKKYLSPVEVSVLFDQALWRLREQELEIKGLAFSSAFRAATLEDLTWCQRAVTAFIREALPHQPIQPEAIAQKCRSKIARQKLYLWCPEEEPVAMAACVRETPSVAAVSLVYTPPEQRGKGYAKSVTAALSELLLQRFQACCLFTDLSHPVSGIVYQRIGYQVIEKFSLLSLTASGA